jgi:hypothetical protein
MVFCSILKGAPLNSVPSQMKPFVTHILYSCSMCAEASLIISLFHIAQYFVRIPSPSSARSKPEVVTESHERFYGVLSVEYKRA